jgi:hypothetical protein
MEPSTLRLLERILDVAIGGISIYLGYRLFLRLPESTDSSGKVILPGNISVYLSRVGPGVFFALFGALVVGVSLETAVRYSEREPANTDTFVGKPAAKTVRESSKNFIGLGSAIDSGDSEGVADARSLLRKEIAIMNTIPAELKSDLSQQDRDEVMRAISRIKFALMKPVWDSRSGWGDPAQFEEWLKAGAPDPPPARLEQAVEYFRYGQRRPAP